MPTLHARPADPQALKAAAAVAAAGAAGGAPALDLTPTTGRGVRLDLGGEAGVLEDPNAIARYLGELGD